MIKTLFTVSAVIIVGLFVYRFAGSLPASASVWFSMYALFITLAVFFLRGCKERHTPKPGNERDQFWHGYDEARHAAAMGDSKGQIEYQFLYQGYSDEFKRGVKQWLKHH